MEEIWKPIRGYEKDYEISNKGRIKSYRPQYVINKGYVNKDGHIMKPSNNGRGYLIVFLAGKGFRDRRYIHRLVAMHFLKENYFQGAEVNHKDGDKSNNCIENLEWLSTEDNKKHAIETGLFDQRGSKGRKTHLSDLQATAIKRLYNNKLMTSGEIMHLFDVNRHTVLDISSGKSFRYLD
ncbi:MAG: NUMOD4 motif-containing HNH endonuclease [Lactococcus lactis]|uniref:NUMOD4 domain-containing protein n=1 Tax=Tetragenococcus halophilus TaxID=51669 RepID=UPI0026509C0D|nr:NUMOD4 motif-containing HNH endonuclease [Lactococcus lactis]